MKEYGRNIRTMFLLEVGRFNWKKYERVIVLSPHLDDAALSCGGLLTAIKGKVSRLVVTIACGNPAPNPLDSCSEARKKPRARKGHASPTQRRGEDVDAMHSIDCDFVHLGFEDAIYRRSPTSGNLIYRSARSKWSIPSREDAGYIEELYFVLKRLCQNMGRVLIVSPLGVGFHVDHTICAQVALRLATSPLDILFYEDFPYIFDSAVGSGMNDDPFSAMERLGVTPEKRMAVPYDVTAKARLLIRYRSQFPMLFENEKGMLDGLNSRLHKGVPTEILWDTEIPDLSEENRSSTPSGNSSGEENE